MVRFTQVHGDLYAGGSVAIVRLSIRGWKQAATTMVPAAMMRGHLCLKTTGRQASLIDFAAKGGAKTGAPKSQKTQKSRTGKAANGLQALSSATIAGDVSKGKNSETEKSRTNPCEKADK